VKKKEEREKGEKKRRKGKRKKRKGLAHAQACSPPPSPSFKLGARVLGQVLFKRYALNLVLNK